MLSSWQFSVWRQKSHAGRSNILLEQRQNYCCRFLLIWKATCIASCVLWEVAVKICGVSVVSQSLTQCKIFVVVQYTNHACSLLLFLTDWTCTCQIAAALSWLTDDWTCWLTSDTQVLKYKQNIWNWRRQGGTIHWLYTANKEYVIAPDFALEFAGFFPQIFPSGKMRLNEGKIRNLSGKIR